MTVSSSDESRTNMTVPYCKMTSASKQYWKRSEEWFPAEISVVRSDFKIKKDKVSKGAKIRNQYNQVPHLTQDTNEKVIN